MRIRSEQCRGRKRSYLSRIKDRLAKAKQKANALQHLLEENSR